MLNNNDPGPHICIVQSERLVSKCVMGAWFQFVDVGKKTFSTNSLLPEFFFPLNSSFSILQTGKQKTYRLSGKEVEFNQGLANDARTSSEVTGR